LNEKIREGLRIFCEEGTFAGPSYPDLCHLGPNLVLRGAKRAQSDMKEGKFESSPSVVERQETNLAVDSFDYFVMKETT
jgi:hypothetical protein